MADPQNFSNAQNTEPQNPNARPAEVYKFSADELRVLQQCNAESFYQRSLPIGSFLGISTFYAVKTGYLRGHGKFGAGPKVALAVIAGYFIGKVSYQQKCAEKFMALPNSQMGEMLRKRKRQGINENISLDPGFSAPLNMESTSFQEVQPRQSYLDMDSDRPYVGSFDRPNLEEAYDVSTIPVAPAGAPPITYDDLRRRNREEHDAQKYKPGYRPSEDPPATTRAPAQAPTYNPAKPKNKYGDEWE